MAFATVYHNRLNFVKGDKTKVSIYLVDKNSFRKSNGVHCRVDSATDLETLGTLIEGCSDCVFYSYQGQFFGTDTVKYNSSKTDIPNDSVYSRFTLSGTDIEGETWSWDIVFPKMLSQEKLSDVAFALKALKWFDNMGEKLSNIKVRYNSLV